MARICGFSASTLSATAATDAGRAMAGTLEGDAPEPVTVPAGGDLYAASAADLYRSSDGQVTTAIEGEPRWHRRELAATAREQGHAAALAEAWRTDGERLLTQLGGTFALAVRDTRNDTLVLAVDRMGVRPMCYARTADGGIAFGTTTFAVLAHPGVVDDLSHQAIYNYVYFHVIPSPGTVFARVAKLEPAQVLRFAGGEVHTSFYWAPRFDQPLDERGAELEQRLMETMRDAVRRAGPGNGSGCFLSGGLDSSTVCGLASDVSDAPVKAFSIGFDQEGYDEIEFARAAAEHFRLDLTEYYVTPDDVADAVGIIATAYDEPFGNSSAIPAYFCARKALEHGVSRLIAGDGGDELFAGNERYARQQVFEHYGRVPGWLRSGVLEPVFSSKLAQSTALTRKVGRYIEQARVPLPERLETYNLLHVRAPDTVFGPDFLATVDPRSPIKDMDTWYRRANGAGLVDRMLYFDWKLTLADNDLRKVNRMCEVAGVAVAYPMLDDDLVTLSTRIPPELKLRRGDLRYFFKQTVRDFLPRKIINKQKHGFGLPFGEWAASPGRLQDHVRASLAALGKRNILHPDFVAQLVHSHRTEHAAFYGNFLWVLAMLEDWLGARQGT